METQTIWGTVAGDGSILSGAGYTVNKQSGGIYQINFIKPFLAIPAAVGTQTGGGLGQSALDNVIFATLRERSAIVKTGGANGDTHDRQFSFIIMGAVE